MRCNEILADFLSTIGFNLANIKVTFGLEEIYMSMNLLISMLMTNTKHIIDIFIKKHVFKI